MVISLLANALSGKLNLHAIPHNPITLGGAISIVAIVMLVLGFVTYKRKWKWLWREWLTTTNHKRIGVMYIIVAVAMGLRGLADAILLRTQQATSVGASHGIISSNQFQQIFSAHGTIMIFFVAMGLMFGIINLIVPLQIGARDVAFPFLNATSFWLFTGGMILVNLSLIIGEFSAAGWLAYPPLSELQYSPGVGIDYWVWALQIAGVGSLLSGINFLVTIIRLRAPGMTLMKMPMFTWSVLGTMSLVAFAFPILTVTITLLYLDRTFGTHFFTATGGGNPMMYVNLIWAWGHPEVYILVIPAFGVFSEVVPVFSRKRLFGYTSMVWAIWGIVALSFTVWLHHFFTMGAGADVNAFFGITTMLIAIPTGVKIFNWLFTMYRGKVRFTTPMIFFMGFVFLFTLGGVAGVLLAVPAIDYQVHNSLFLVAHFHTMIVTGVLFGFFAGLNYWWPKIFGWGLNDRLGRYSAWCWIVGFILAFGPLYILGLSGATRRLDHYSAATGWHALFIAAAVGVGIICLGVAIQLLQIGYSYLMRDVYRDKTGDPWDGRTLEWATTSPPPPYDFAVIPVVTERDAFWAAKHRETKTEPLVYRPFREMKNTGVPIVVGACALALGFGAVWHIWWLVVVALLIAVVTLIVRLTGDNFDRVVSVDELKTMEAKVSV